MYIKVTCLKATVGVHQLSLSFSSNNMSFSTNNTTSGFAALCEVAEARSNELELEQYSQLQNLPKSENEQEKFFSITNTFINANGFDAIVGMTNFTTNKTINLFAKW